MVNKLASGARALQHLDNVVVMNLARDLQRRLTIIVLLVLVGARLGQQSHDLEVTILASHEHRRHTVSIARLVLVGTRLDQHSHNLDVTMEASAAQRHSALIIIVGTGQDWQAHDLQVTFLASDVQRCHTIRIARLVQDKNFGTVVQGKSKAEGCLLFVTKVSKVYPLYSYY
jgi:hypothetical protein